jgi:maltose O-acetyltransferase
MKNMTVNSCLIADVINIFPNIVVFGAKYIQLGKSVSINKFCYLVAYPNAQITIGDDVLIAPYVLMNTGDHNYKKINVKIRDQGHNYKAITIGNDVWIGARCTILKGVIIPDKCVILAREIKIHLALLVICMKKKNYK